MRHLWLVCLFAGSAAARSASSAMPPLALVDDVGSTVLVTGVPHRIVSVSPGGTEILFALGAGPRIVGLCAYCNYPPAVTACVRVGDFANPSLEAILAARPDLVVSNGGPQRELVEHLRQAGVPTLVLLPRSVAEVYGNISLLGRVLGRETAAATLTQHMRDRVAALSRDGAKVPEARRPKVYFEIWSDPFMAIGDESIPGELIRLAGGVNVAHGARGDYPKLSGEQIIAANPDVIILSHCDDPKGALAAVAGRPGWSRLRAVQDGRVYCDLDMDLLLRPGPRLTEGLAMLKARILP